MTPDEHRKRAESYLARAEEGGSPTYVASMERRAIAHAALSIPGTRAPRGERPAPKPAPRPKKKATPKPKGSES